MLNKIIAVLLALAVSPAQTVLCKTVDNFRVQDQIGFSSLDSGPSAFAPSNSYSIDPQTQLDSYNQERINKLSEHLTQSGIDHHINIKTGYGCDANVCASVSYRIEGRIHTFEINQGGISMPGRPPQISPCMSCTMATPSPSYGDDPNNYNQGPSPFAKSRYNSALRELENVKRRLSDLNMKQSSVRSRLLSKESALNSAVRNANLAMSSMRAAGARARQKKQEAQNSKIEAERLAAEKWRQEERKEQLGKDIAAAEDVFDDLMNEIDNELKDISGDKYQEYANNSFSRDQVEGHNSASADINDVSRINEGIELLDIDLTDMIKVDKPVDLDEVESLGLKTPKDHKEYRNLHTTKRYSKEVRTQLAEEGKLTTTKESFLDLADALIEMADNAFFGGEDTEGKDFLAKGAMMVDFALDFVPGASAINDGVKIALGKNPWTGEEISDLETGMLIGGFFAPAIISGSAKVVSKIAGRLSKSVLPGAKRLLKKIKGADAKLGGSKVPCVTRSSDCYVPGGPVDEMIKSAQKLEVSAGKTDEFVEASNVPFFRSPESNKIDFEKYNSSLGSPDDFIKRSDGSVRLSYKRGFNEDLVNFNPGHILRNETLSEDLVLVQFHAATPLVANNGRKRSLKWWTTTKQANELRTVDDVRSKLALPKDWGDRNIVTVAVIPKGTKIKAHYGTAKEQTSNIYGIKYPGGGIQYRFEDFSTDWLKYSARVE